MKPLNQYRVLVMPIGLTIELDKQLYDQFENIDIVLQISPLTNTNGLGQLNRMHNNILTQDQIAVG